MSKNNPDIHNWTKEERERFWAKVNKSSPNECWEWQGARNTDGYGRYSVSSKILSSHRIAYTLEYGSTPAEMLVCHKCDNPPCCNPNHLFLGTYMDNNSDCSLKGRYQSRPKGSGNYAAKLNERNIIDIRRVASEGLAQRKIASLYNVSPSLISRILSGEDWKHVTN